MALVADWGVFVRASFGAWDVAFFVLAEGALLAYARGFYPWYVRRQFQGHTVTPKQPFSWRAYVIVGLVCWVIAAFAEWREQYARANVLAAPRLEMQLFYSAIMVDDETNRVAVMIGTRLDNVGNGGASNCRSYTASVDGANGRLYGIPAPMQFRPEGLEIYPRDKSCKLTYGRDDDRASSCLKLDQPLRCPKQFSSGNALPMRRKQPRWCVPTRNPTTSQRRAP